MALSPEWSLGIREDLLRSLEKEGRAVCMRVDQGLVLEEELCQDTIGPITRQRNRNPVFQETRFKDDAKLEVIMT